MNFLIIKRKPTWNATKNKFDKKKEEEEFGWFQSLSFVLSSLTEKRNEIN